jgi:hypothetical protein
MDKTQKVMAISMIGVLVGTAIGSLQELKKEKAKRRQIEIQKDKELKHIWTANGAIMDRIQRGEYNSRFGQLMTDFEFEILKNRYENR